MTTFFKYRSLHIQTMTFLQGCVPDNPWMLALVWFDKFTTDCRGQSYTINT